MAGLASRIGLHTGTGQRLDTTRAAWTTSANYYASHQALQDILLTEELFKLNPEYYEANPTAQPKMICLRPEALYSSDETDISLGQSLRKGKNDVCVFLDTLDDQNIATTKTSRKISWQYGRCGDGSMLSPLIVYGGIKDSLGIKLDWIDSSIVGDISDDSGVPIPT